MEIKFYEILNEKERDEVADYSVKILWGFSPESIREQIKRFENGDIKEKAKVCYLLEDCNYHTLCGLLANEEIAEAYKWVDKEMPLEEDEDIPIEEPNPQKNVVEAWILEGSKGKYLHINSTEDGNGTWFDWTGNVFESYWNKSLEDLKNIAETEFSDFEENYPKFHKVRFTAEVLETAQAD